MALEFFDEVGAAVALHVMCKNIHITPEKRMLRNGQKDASAGAEGPIDFPKNPIILLNVFDHIKGPN